MRCDTPVYFQRIESRYDAASGNSAEEVTREELRWASVTDTGAGMLQLVYGALKQDSKTIRLQNHYTEPFDRIKIGGQVYKVDRERKLRTKHIFIVSGVQ